MFGGYRRTYFSFNVRKEDGYFIGLRSKSWKIRE